MSSNELSEKDQIMNDVEQHHTSILQYPVVFLMKIIALFTALFKNMPQNSPLRQSIVQSMREGFPDDGIEGMTAKEAGELFGVSRQTVERAEKVERNYLYWIKYPFEVFHVFISVQLSVSNRYCDQDHFLMLSLRF